MSSTTTDHLKREAQIRWTRLETRALRALASRLSPYMPQGVHIHGNFKIDTDKPLSISGVGVHGAETGFSINAGS